MMDEAVGATSGDAAAAPTSLVGLIRRRWRPFVAVLLGSLLTAVVVLRVWQPPYVANATIHIPTLTAGSIQNAAFDLDYTDRLLNTYIRLGSGKAFRTDLARRLGGGATPTVHVTVPGNTELLVVRGTSPDPARATATAAAAADLLVTRIRQDLTARYAAARIALRRQLDGVDDRLRALATSVPDPAGERAAILSERDALQRSYNEVVTLEAASLGGLSVAEAAEAPEERSGPTAPLLLGAAGLLGLLGGLIVAALVDRLDRRRPDVRAVAAQHGTSVVGDLVIRPSARDGHRLFEEQGVARTKTPTASPTVLALAYQLRAHLPPVESLRGPAPNQQRSFSKQPPCDDGAGYDCSFAVMLAPAASRQPSLSPFTIELGRAYTLMGLDVILVDADIQQPTLHRDLRLPGQPGLGDALQSGKPLSELTISTDDGKLKLLPAGHLDEDGPLVADPGRMRELVTSADVVIVLAPPLLGASEASLLAPSIDLMLVTVCPDSCSGGELDAALAHAAALPAPLVGIVVTRRAGRPRRR